MDSRKNLGDIVQKTARMSQLKEATIASVLYFSLVFPASPQIHVTGSSGDCGVDNLIRQP